MKKLSKILSTIAVAAIAMVGCEISGLDAIEQKPEAEPTGTFRVAASTGAEDGAETKVNIDGTEITWNENDCISIAEVGENGEFISSSEYQIDASTISENGKYAEFVGPDLYEGRSYRAYNYPGEEWQESGVIITDEENGISNWFKCNYSYEYYNPYNVDLVMQSDAFNYDGENTPELSFEHKSSVLDLTISLDPSCEWSGKITTISISNSANEPIFLSSVVFDSNGDYTTDAAIKYSATSSIILKHEFELNQDAPLSIKVPLTWNSAITDIDGNLEFTISTEDGKSNTITKPIKVLKNGVRYSASLVFNEPEFYGGLDVTSIPDNEIWYTTADGALVIFSSFGCGFDANIVSNTYYNGKGVILFDDSLTAIEESAFFSSNLTSIVLPKSISKLGTQLFSYSDNLREIIINSDKISFNQDMSAFWRECYNLTNFRGPLASSDGKCIVQDGELIAFAPYGMTEYTTPKDITAIANNAFYQCPLKSITISEGVTRIGSEAFKSELIFPLTNETKLEYIYLPSSVNEIDFYAFAVCPHIKKFKGDCKLISDDGYSLVCKRIDCLGNPYVEFATYASAADLTSYTIPDGVTLVGNYSFSYAEELKEITFPSSVNSVGMDAFFQTFNIEKIYGDNVLCDNRSLVVDGRLIYVAPSGLTNYTTPEEVTTLGYGVLSNKSELEEAVISDNVIDVEALGYMFNFSNRNPKLKTITISARMKNVGWDPFGDPQIENNVLETVYLRAPIPPAITHNFPDYIPTAFPNMTIYIPEESLNAYMNNPDWRPYKGYFKGYDYGDLSEFYPEGYVPDDTDYTHDGEVVTLQTATVGDGVDLVIVGDGFDDTTMEVGGEYETRAKEAMEHFFSEEPYTTLRDRYNVYAVKAVSIDDGVEGENKTTFGTQFTGGTGIAGDDNKIFKYAMLVPEISSTDDLTVLAIVNSPIYAGTCYMYFDNDASIAYCPIVENNDEQFRQIVTHECAGHGFAKLMDEYCYEGTIPDWAIADYEMQRDLGWGANVDITDDPATIQWAHFLSDPLYDGQVGIYEGALTFEFGAYRPTDTSIMRYNVGGYNAPSREAIYKRIMELSGEGYSYEKFVEYDAINRTPSAKAYRAAAARRVNEAAFTPLGRPVVVKGSPNVHK